jgi:hypothetical protein
MVIRKGQNIFRTIWLSTTCAHAHSASLVFDRTASFRETTLECSHGRSSRGRVVGGGRGVGSQTTSESTFCLARVWPTVTAAEQEEREGERSFIDNQEVTDGR